VRALAYDRYGPPEVLELRDVPRPEPGKGEVLVRVHAAGVAAGDWHLLVRTWFVIRLYQGMTRPKRPVLGHELSGVVEAVGEGVERLRVGDEVFGECDAGAFAEFAVAPERSLAPKPANLSHAEAAVVPVSAVTALLGLRDRGRLQPGARTLVIGASGGVGGYAVQLARLLGAAEVVGVASAAKADFVRAQGAARVLDYRTTDLGRTSERFDLVLDNVGTLPLAACRRLLTPTGRYVAVAGAPMRGLRRLLFGGPRTAGLIARTTREDLERLTAWCASGELRPTLDRTFPLERGAEALRAFGNHEARGKLAIVVSAL